MKIEKYLEKHIMGRYRNNETVYNSVESAIMGSMFFSNIGWYKGTMTVFYKGMNPHDFMKLKGGTPEWFEIPLFSPLMFIVDINKVK
jgi:hypothetical protein